MKIAKNAAKTLTAGVIGAALLSSTAFSQSITERAMERYSDPNEFYLTDSRETELIRFKRERLAAICVGDSEYTTPLDVTFDEERGILYPGNCLLVEAKSVKVSAAGEIEDGWALRGTVRTLPE